MNDTSEEKKLAASAKKLADARKKGQVARSADFVTAAGTCAGIFYFWSRSEIIGNDWKEALIFAYELQALPFEVARRQMIAVLVTLGVDTVLPLLGIVLLAGLCASLMANRGFVLSFDPIKPKLENLNPIEGLKRMVGLKSWIELVKTIFKTLLLGAAMLVVLIGMWKSLVFLPLCGVGCIGFVVGTEAKLLLGLAAGAFFSAGILDLLVQRWVFTRDLRMTETEAKREFKEQEGDPILRKEHRRLRRESASGPPLGVRHATLLLRGRDVVVCLRYVRGENDVPIIVCRGRGEAAARLLREAHVASLPVVEDEALALRLSRRVRIGHEVPSSSFQRVAKAFYSAGLA